MGIGNAKMRVSIGGLWPDPHRQLKSQSWVNNWPRIIQDWLYPPTCLLCGDRGAGHHDICGPCAAGLPYLRVACPRCAAPLPTLADTACGQCQNQPPAFDSTHCLLRYEEPVCHLVKALKFGASYPTARLLGNLLADSLMKRGELPEAIIPIPLHRSRYGLRGFNQALEIGRTVARRLGVGLDPSACRRIRATAAQAMLPARERRKNIRGAFAPRPVIGYRHVAILDDVVTTGATVNEVARVLRSAGVERVEVWAIARAGHC